MLLLLGTSALLLGGKKSSSKKSVSYGKDMNKQQRYAMMLEIRKMSAFASNKFGMMPFLADYLTVVGYIESRFNPSLANPEIKKNPSNAARGLFGMRPESAFASSNGLIGLRIRPNLLLNPIWAFCTAVDYVARADEAARERSGRRADWLSVRRWWGRPTLIHDFELSDQKSIDSMERFTNGIEGVNAEYGANINEDFMWADVERGGYSGAKALLKAFGV